MAGSTTELSLSTAVDSDDNADYLTINLANSLRTVDALFSSVTGHTHVGAHQGAPIVPATGSITSAQIADGTIVAADMADAGITNAKLGPDVARASLLTNGGFEIWQRGAGPFTATGAYTADRWVAYVPIGTISVARDAANADTSGYCAAVTVTGGVSAGNAQTLYQYPGATADGITTLPGMTFSLSVRVKTSVVNGCRLSLLATGGTRSYSTYHPGGGTYQTLTVTGYLVAVGTGNPVLSVEINFEAPGTYYVDRANLVVGSQPANYVPMHPADDLARCLRYYEVIADIYPYPLLAGYNTAGANTFISVPYKAIKAVAPTVTKNGTWSVANCAQPTILGSSVQGIVAVINPTATGYASAQPNAAGQNFTVESNP